MKRFSNVTTTQIARICGVSQGTVDRALHNRGEIKEETKQKILAVAKEYDYVPRVGEKATLKGKSMLIGVVLFDLYNEFFSKLAMSLVNQAKKAGYSVVFLFSNKDIKTEKSAIDYFNYIGVDGIVLFSVGSDDEGYATYLRSLMKPIVLIGNRIENLTYIGIDDYRAMYDLTIRQAGEQPEGEIAYFAPVLSQKLSQNNAQTLRAKGFVDAMISLKREYRIVVNTEALKGSAGIVCSTDYYALQALKKLGYAPKEKLAGFDNLSVLKTLRTKILTVEYSTDRIAIECLKCVLGRKYKKEIEYRIVYNMDEDF